MIYCVIFHEMSIKLDSFYAVLKGSRDHKPVMILSNSSRPVL